MNREVETGIELGREGKWNIAAACFERAAKENDPDGVFQLAECYFYGEGKPLDYAKAAELYNLLTADGSSKAAIALYKLALCYRLRKDGYASEEFADGLVRAAADLSCPEALAELGRQEETEDIGS